MKLEVFAVLQLKSVIIAVSGKGFDLELALEIGCGPLPVYQFQGKL